VYNPDTDVPAVEVHIHLSLPGPYVLKVYNSAGELVRTLQYVRDSYAPRDEILSWDGNNDAGDPVASGVYVLHFVSRYESRVAKLLILR
jgi:flagellar hook assembly protein FlgD